MAKLNTIEMPEEQAKKLWKEYNEVIKKRKEKYLKDLKACYYQLSKGKKLIDIYAIMSKTKLDVNGEPRLAIARADWKEVFFNKRDTGTGVFSDQTKMHWDDTQKGEVGFPSQTFPNWKRKKDKDGNATSDIWRERISAGVPLIPAKFLPEGSLENYYILWEIKDWKEFIPPARDPFLLKRLTNNLFAVLAAWDITALERSIIAGKQ